jgi:hypothetical protein
LGGPTISPAGCGALIIARRSFVPLSTSRSTLRKNQNVLVRPVPTLTSAVQEAELPTAQHKYSTAVSSLALSLGAVSQILEPPISPFPLATMPVHQSTATAVAVATFIAVAALALGPRAAGAVLLDFEGVSNGNRVGNFYAGGNGVDYGITFGRSVFGIVDEDAGGSFKIANEPSPESGVLVVGNESEAFVTVPAGFRALSFQYASQDAVTATVYDGPNVTGTVLGTTILPPPGACNDTACGDPRGGFGIWTNVTVAFSGVARSAGFSTAAAFIAIDDMVVRLASETDPPTKAPTKPPTKAPTKKPVTKPPTKAPAMPPARPTCLRKGVKGVGMRCMMMMMMMVKPKVA